MYSHIITDIVWLYGHQHTSIKYLRYIRWQQHSPHTTLVIIFVYLIIVFGLLFDILDAELIYFVPDGSKSIERKRFSCIISIDCLYGQKMLF